MTPPEFVTTRLRLTPLRVADAEQMLGVLSDPRLYDYTGETAPTIDALRTRYQRQVDGAPLGSSESWCNWIIRWRPDDAPVGFVQATVVGTTADLAWLVAIPWQRRGLAKEAARAVRDWLLVAEVEELRAHIHPDHIASQRVATAIGLRNTATRDQQGEEVWASA